LQAGWSAQLVCYTAGLDERRQRLVDAFIAAGVETEQVSDSVMQAMSDTKTPQGVLAVLGVVDIPLPEYLSFVLILDGVRDPGNLGAILRSAAASGVDGVVLTPGSVEIYSPKVLRAAMGAHFRLPVQQFDWEGIKRMLHTAGLRTFMAEVGGGTRYDQADFKTPLALVIGSEAAGASPALQELADERIYIPMVRAVESLNAANAAAVLLFEVVRQRTTSGG
jgi:TrmH family RNA methyltransferase